MKVTRIRDDVWKFKGVGSVYLIKGDKWILIDAGDDKDRGFLEEEISKVVPLDKVGVVLLTHLHHDHLSCIDLFVNAEIYASGEEIAGYMKDAEKFYFYVSKGVDKILREKMRPFPTEKAVGGLGLGVGSKLFGLEVLKVPGHTLGSVAFLDRRRKLMFSGDTIFGGDIIGRTDLPNSVPEKMDGSVKMLRKLVIDEGLGLCPGHGYWEDALR